MRAIRRRGKRKWTGGEAGSRGLIFRMNVDSGRSKLRNPTEEREGREARGGVVGHGRSKLRNPTKWGMWV